MQSNTFSRFRAAGSDSPHAAGAAGSALASPPLVTSSFACASTGSRKSSPSIADQVFYPAAAADRDDQFATASEELRWSADDARTSSLVAAAAPSSPTPPVDVSAAFHAPVTAALGRGPSTMVLSAAAVPWYPAASHKASYETLAWLAAVVDARTSSNHQETHGALQPRQDEFPCEPCSSCGQYPTPTGAGGGRASMCSSNGIAPPPLSGLLGGVAGTAGSKASLCRDGSPGGSIRHSPFPQDGLGGTPMQQKLAGHPSGKPYQNTTRRSNSRPGTFGGQTPHSVGDGDEDGDDYVIMKFRDDEALDEDEMIRRLAEGAFWSTDGPAAEGLHHIRELWDGTGVPRRPRRVRRQVVDEHGNTVEVIEERGDDEEWGDDDEEDEEDFNDWEDDSAAYEDSLDSAQLLWLEDQLRARDNPENFFF